MSLCSLSNLIGIGCFTHAFLFDVVGFGNTCGWVGCVHCAVLSYRGAGEDVCIAEEKKKSLVRKPNLFPAAAEFYSIYVFF